LVPLALVGFLICYVTIEERAAAIMPLWIAFFYFSHKYFFRNSVTRYLLCVMSPFLILVGAAAIIGTSDSESLFYSLFTLATYRIYSVPATAFNVYYNFFHFNPHTYWTHINLVSEFVRNPYGQPLALVMQDSYRAGNYNASFLETDGLAAAGIAALPWICVVFGVILVAINTCARRLDTRALALVMAGPSIAMIDTGIGPSLLTNGVALLALVLLLAPRVAPWTTDSKPGSLDGTF